MDDGRNVLRGGRETPPAGPARRCHSEGAGVVPERAPAAGLFSGFGERALPQAAEVVHTEDEGERMLACVQLTHVDRHPRFPVTDVWHRAVVLTADGGSWRIDDVRILDDETLDDRGGIDEILSGCDRGRWIGHEAWKKRRR